MTTLTAPKTPYKQLPRIDLQPRMKPWKPMMRSISRLEAQQPIREAVTSFGWGRYLAKNLQRISSILK